MGQIALTLLAALLSLAPAGPQEQPEQQPENGPAEAEEFPSVEEALGKEIHGKYKTGKKGRLQVYYDFKDEAQRGDFSEASRWIQAAGANVPLPVKKLKHATGKLFFPGSDSITSNIPMKQIASVSFRAMGVDDINVVLRGGGITLIVDLDRSARMYIGEVEDFDWGRDRRLNLDAKKIQSFEVVIQRRKAFAKLNGKKVLEVALPRDFPAMESVYIRTGTRGKPHLTELRLSGLLSEEAVVIAANRDRARDKKPPLWPVTFRAEGDHFTVLTPVSQELADQWYLKLDAQATSLLNRYPPPPKKAGFRRGVYIFQSLRVYSAYTSAAPAANPRLPSGDLAFLATDEASDEVQRRILWLTASQLIDHTMPAASYWWKTGHMAYYGSVEQDGDAIRFGAITAEAATAVRDHLERKADPRLSKLLEGDDVEKWSIPVVALCWTWVSFLDEADGGVYHAYLGRYYKAITVGDKSGREAGAEVFPVEKFNELFARFEIYLEGL